MQRMDSSASSTTTGYTGSETSSISEIFDITDKICTFRCPNVPEKCFRKIVFDRNGSVICCNKVESSKSIKDQQKNRSSTKQNLHEEVLLDSSKLSRHFHRNIFNPSMNGFGSSLGFDVDTINNAIRIDGSIKLERITDDFE